MKICVVGLALCFVSACASTVSQSATGPDVADAAIFDAPEATVDQPSVDQPSVDRPPRDASVVVPSRLTIREGAAYLRRLNGTAVAWGDYSGPLGGVLSDAGLPAALPRAVPATAERLFVGRDSECSLDRDGNVRCWGENADGQLGNGSRVPAAAPGTIILDNVTELAPSLSAWCALRRDGSVWCWGSYLQGSGLEPGVTPRRIEIAAPMERLFGTSTTDFFNGLDASGRIWCWGSGGSLCLVDRQTDLVAAEIPHVPDVISVVQGRGFSCALSSNGEVYCWGQVPLGIMGPNNEDLSTPTVADAYRGAIALSAGRSFLCALMPSGEVICGGSQSPSGKLGYYQRSSGPYQPRTVPELHDVIEIGSGLNHNCALTRSDDVYCWGSNIYHSIGQPDGITRADIPLRLQLP